MALSLAAEAATATAVAAAKWLCVGLCAVLLVCPRSCGAGGASSTTTPPPALGFFSELPSPALSKYFTNETFALLEALNVNRKGSARVIIGTVDLSDERAEVIRELNRRGISVTVWALCTRANGYWFSMDNFVAAAARYREIRGWIQHHKLSVSAIGMDLEADRRNMVEIQKHEWLLLLESVLTRNAARLAEAKAAYRKLALQIRADGYLVETYTLPFAYDEAEVRGSTLLERIIGFVNLDRDVVDISQPMLYSSLFPYGLGMMQSYMNVSDGTDAAIAVGITGGAGNQGNGTTYASVEQFLQDLRWCHQVAHKPYIGVYSWEGLLDRGWANGLTTLDWDKPLGAVLQTYRTEAIIVDEQRQSLRALLEASVKPFKAAEWAALHPIEVFEHIFEFLEAWYEWRNGNWPGRGAW